MRDALGSSLRFLRLLVVIVALVVLFADASEVAFLLLLVGLGVALGEEDLGVDEFVNIRRLLNIRYATLDVLLFKIEYLILRNLPTEVQCFILRAEQGVVILRVAEAVDLNVNLVVRAPKVRRILVLLGIAVQARITHRLERLCLIAKEIVGLARRGCLLLYLRAT